LHGIRAMALTCPDQDDLDLSPVRSTVCATEDLIHYVLDTSVLLSDPGALWRFDEHHVVIPLVVIDELEAKRLHPELGEPARRAIRALEDIRSRHTDLTVPVQINERGGTLRVEVNHRDQKILPPPLRGKSNDVRILTVAAHLRDEGLSVVIVTKDLPLRLRSGSLGIRAEEYRNEQAIREPWSGVATIETSKEVIDRLYAGKPVGLSEVDPTETLDLNTCLILKSGSSSSLSRVEYGIDRSGLAVRQIVTPSSVFGLKARSAEQRFALDLLVDETIQIVSLGGPAGTGKTILSLAAGLEGVIEQRRYKKIVVFRPLYAVGGQDLGFLPGDAQEKMDPWAAAVFDALDAFVDPAVLMSVRDRRQLEVLPLTHIRGRTLSNAFVIIDEAQNLERSTLITALSRMGEGSKVVLAHDVDQRDNLHVGRLDGVLRIVEMLRGQKIFGHLTLTRTERSGIARLVTDLAAMDSLHR
jgi:PhoH-like ATPase